MPGSQGDPRPGPVSGPLPRASYVRAFSTLGCPDLDLAGVLRLADLHGIGAVELRAIGGTVDLPAYFSGLADSTQRLSRIVGESRVRIVSLSTSLSLIDASESDIKAFLEFVPWAEAMGIPWLRVFDGGRACDAAELARASAVVSRWKALRASRGWKADIMVETHDALATSSAIMRFVQAVPGVRILWDTHHTWRTGGEMPSDTWRAIAPSVVHLHVKDSRLEDKPGSPAFYRLPGTGDYPMGELLGALGDAYSGAVSLEWERMWHPQLPPLDEALRSAAALSWW